MSIYQHFRQEEHDFIDQVLEWKVSVIELYASKLTDFLDPREQEIVKSVVGNNDDVKLAFHGGANGAERKRALLYPPYLEPSADDFGLKAYDLSYPEKFVKIEHRQVLGSLMGIGLKRSKFGDIYFHDSSIQIVLSAEVSAFVEMQLQEVGKVKVSLNELPLEHLESTETSWEEASTTAASLRLDVMIASIYNLSRQKAQLLIGAKKVKINWKLVEQTAFECQEGDILSVRGFGRSKLLTVDGKTKKDKWRIIVGKQK
ncbi:RNA-binding protein [Sutcliffiella horikoshii]|uniref:RNA-binding protein n=1 Tax=Sutcliffiella horikoshii TaxID=79883 RepID=A0AA95B7U3_9BACI|nr:RNA-binding protein [Sutcliffiella horikoshii]TYS61533.1 RNA-binding protein [Sutcliffiella horikoshii]